MSEEYSFVVNGRPVSASADGAAPLKSLFDSAFDKRMRNLPLTRERIMATLLSE